jgi:hypothetical protein
MIGLVTDRRQPARKRREISAHKALDLGVSDLDPVQDLQQTYVGNPLVLLVNNWHAVRGFHCMSLCPTLISALLRLRQPDKRKEIWRRIC